MPALFANLCNTLEECINETGKRNCAVTFQIYNQSS